MKKLLLVVLIYTMCNAQLFACTTFFINKNGQMVFGRNYDWVTSSGMVCTNLRGLQKTSMKTEDGGVISWMSQYGSITFNQYGKEFPTGGMNEKGLVVELMWLDDTKYPEPDSRPAIGVLQWIQFQLDKSASVDEVIASDKMVRIASKGTVPLHYLVADASGKVATIEFLNGKMTVHKDKQLPYPVLTNNNYDESIQRTKNAGGGQSFTDNSIERFAKACNMVSQIQTTNTNLPVIEYAFNILDEVAQPGFTKWSIVYDITNRKINFKSDRQRNIKTIGFSSFNFECTSESKMLDINQNQNGEVSGLFKGFSVERSKPVLVDAIRESRKEVPISEKTKDAILNYNREIKCK